MKSFVVGTAGHVDHGKTALVRALTGTETDRWREERERGLTIDLGFARLPLDDELEVGVVDVPGHEDFVKNMLAGATGVDLLLLVVAADEGPMPQTREHLGIARMLGVEEGVVALTKRDRVEPGWLELAADAAREELRAVLGHDRWPVLPVSSTTGEGLDALREEIRRRAASVRSRAAADLFRMPVDRSFSVAGAGTVVTGTTWSGRLRVGEEVRVLPLDRSCRVRSIQGHGEAREEASAGRRTALALVGVDPAEIPRGSVVLSGEGWRCVRRLGVRLRLLPAARWGVEDGQRVRVYLGTAEVFGRVELPGAEALASRSEAWARLSLERPLVARARDRFVLRFYSPVVTIGGGEVAELEAPAGWRGRTEEWRRILDGGAAEAAEAAVRLSGGEGLSASWVPLLTGLAASRAPGALDSAGSVRRFGDRWFSESAAERCAEALLGELADLLAGRRRAPGISLEALRAAVTRRRFHAALVEGSLARLQEDGRILVEGPEVRLPGHRPRLRPEEREASDVLLEAIRAGDLEPPTLGALRKGARLSGELLHDLLELLVREGRIVAVTPELFLSAEAARKAREAVLRVLRRQGTAEAGALKAELGVSRKYLIPILEHLDRTGLTRRTGEGRVLAGD